MKADPETTPGLRKRMLAWGATITLLVLASGCSGMKRDGQILGVLPAATATADAQVVARAVEATLTASAPTATETVEPTATTLPTETCTPTETPLPPTATRTPQPPTTTRRPFVTYTLIPTRDILARPTFVPAVWKLYNDPDAGFVMWHPAGWKAKRMGPVDVKSMIKFESPQYSVLITLVDATPTEDNLDRLVQANLDVINTVWDEANLGEYQKERGFRFLPVGVTDRLRDIGAMVLITAVSVQNQQVGVGSLSMANKSPGQAQVNEYANAMLSITLRP